MLQSFKNYLQKVFTKPFLEVFPLWWIAGLVFLLFLDLASKKWITQNLNFHLTYEQLQNVKNHPYYALMDGIPYIPVLGEDGKYLKLRLVFNDRFIFGLGPSVPTLGIFLTLFAILFLFFYRWIHYDFGHPVAWMFIFAGATGNFIDKLFIKSVETREWVFSLYPREGYVSGVVDFLEAIWFGWEMFENVPVLSFLAWNTWPTFNIADSVIVIGISMLLLENLLSGQWKQNKVEKKS